MTNGEVSQTRKPLPMWPVLREACLLPWNHRQHFGRLLIIPVVLITLMSIANSYWFAGKGTSSTTFEIITWLELLPHYLIFTFFAVSCHRSILIGEHSVSRFGVPGWSMRETRFFLFLVAIYVAAWIIAIVYEILFGIGLALTSGTIKGIMGKPIPFLDDPLRITFVLMTLAAIPFAYIIGRSSLMLPAIAVDLRPRLNPVLSYSEGNGWRVTVLVGWIPLLFVALQFLFGLAIGRLTGISNAEGLQWLGVYSIVTSGSQAFLHYALSTIEVAILSLTFKELSGWQPNAVFPTQVP